MSYKVRKKGDYLCPYCKKDYFEFTHAFEAGKRAEACKEIHCLECGWFKEDIDITKPWGPYSPDVIICSDNDVYHNKPDLTPIKCPLELWRKVEVEERPLPYVGGVLSITRQYPKPRKKRKKEVIELHPGDGSRWEELN